VFILALVFIFPAHIHAQSDIVRMSLSTELKSDPEQMNEAETINAGDPVYFVIKLNPKYKYTLGDMASTDPKTGEKNVFICFDMNSYKVGEVCSGILKSPVSEQDLNRKSAVYTLIPAANDMNAENIKTIRQILDGIDSKLGQDFDLRITYKNFDNQKSASFKAPISMANYDKSRWHDYNSQFANREAVAQKQKELDTTVVPQAGMHDPVAEKELLAAAQSLFGTSSKIYKAVITSSQWTYEKNDYGILLSRAVYVSIMRKETASGNCFVDNRLYAKQEFLSGNNWAPIRLWWKQNYSSLLNINCDKFAGFK
jgi:hypothetical protein